LPRAPPSLTDQLRERRRRRPCLSAADREPTPRARPILG
jgi:hypothetical protein